MINTNYGQMSKFTKFISYFLRYVYFDIYNKEKDVLHVIKFIYNDDNILTAKTSI